MTTTEDPNGGVTTTVQSGNTTTTEDPNGGVTTEVKTTGN
jgi:hypothetical protein